MCRRLSFALFCLMVLLGSAAASSVASASRQAAALWLSQQLHHPVNAAQILVSPDSVTFNGCTIARIRRTPSKATSISLHCPSYVLPQLVLLDPSVELNEISNGSSPSTAWHREAPLVRAGATLHADWRTDSLHAELPVIALDSGVAGGEIRVRIANTNRVFRARILSAHNVTIVAVGA